MRADVLIIGQGLAGSLLGWGLEQAGIPFVIADAGHAAAATSAAAGIINPITGRRLVKSWRVEELLPAARTTYRQIGDALAAPLWREMRVRRLFADERERATFAAKRLTGELAPFLGASDEEGFWVEGAARADVARLLGALRRRWEQQNRLRTAVVSAGEESGHFAVVVDCTGVAAAQSGAFAAVPWQFSKGEVLEVAVDGLAPDVVLNRRHWVCPLTEGVAWVGATHEPGVLDRTPTAAARAALEASARSLVPGVVMTGQRAGVRVNLPDKHPVLGRHPDKPRIGLINGLGAKGALLAPMLAQAWVRHLQNGTAFDPSVDLARFDARAASAARCD